MLCTTASQISNLFGGLIWNNSQESASYYIEPLETTKKPDLNVFVKNK